MSTRRPRTSASSGNCRKDVLDVKRLGQHAARHNPAPCHQHQRIEGAPNLGQQLVNQGVDIAPTEDDAFGLFLFFHHGG
jgi:hypothetical protein